jgi:hypothetical protein
VVTVVLLVFVADWLANFSIPVHIVQ